MASEIRTLKDGETQVLPRTTAQAVSTSDGTTIDVYIDKKIAEIPVPDVSEQINIHNTDETAHQDIQDKIDNLKLGTSIYCQAGQPSNLSVKDFWFQII